MSVDEKVGPQPRVLSDSLDMPQPAGAPCAAGPSGIAGARASLAAAGRTGCPLSSSPSDNGRTSTSSDQGWELS
jgi:hypothetical protein